MERNAFIDSGTSHRSSSTSLRCDRAKCRYRFTVPTPQPISWAVSAVGRSRQYVRYTAARSSLRQAAHRGQHLGVHIGWWHRSIGEGDAVRVAPGEGPGLVEDTLEQVGARVVQVGERATLQDTEHDRGHEILRTRRTNQDSGVPDELVAVTAPDIGVTHSPVTLGRQVGLHGIVRLSGSNPGPPGATDSCHSHEPRPDSAVGDGLPQLPHPAERVAGGRYPWVPWDSLAALTGVRCPTRQPLGKWRGLRLQSPRGRGGLATPLSAQPPPFPGSFISAHVSCAKS